MGKTTFTEGLLKSMNNPTPTHFTKRLLELSEEPNVTTKELGNLISQGADVNAKDISDGTTPLHNLISSGNEKAVELLLSRGADIAMCDSIGRNSLHIAAFKNNLELVELLLKQGTLTDEDKNKKDDDKNQPLYWAIKNENYEMIKKLLENGANLNVDSNGFKNSSIEFCRKFLKTVEDCQTSVSTQKDGKVADFLPELQKRVEVYDIKERIKLLFILQSRKNTKFSDLPKEISMLIAEMLCEDSKLGFTTIKNYSYKSPLQTPEEHHRLDKILEELMGEFNLNI